MRSLTINLYGDELSLLGDNYLDAYTGLKYLVHRNIRDILKSKKSSWIDNIESKMKIEIKIQIIFKRYNFQLLTYLFFSFF